MVDTQAIEHSIETTVAKVAGIPSVDLENTPAVPSFLVTLTHDYSQKLLTAGSVWLLAHGLSNFTNQTDLVSFGVGVFGLILSCMWTIGIAYLRKEKMTTLLNFIPK